MSVPMPTGPTDPTMSGGGSATPARKSGSSLMPAVKPAAITVGAFAAVLVVVEIINSLTGYALNRHLGIVSRTTDGLLGVVAAPFLHANWGHLLSNLIPVVVLGFLAMIGGIRQFVAVTLLVWLISGFGVWLFGPSHTVTVGASALVFGWLAYLVTRGVFNRSVGQIAVGVLLLAVWGGIFWTGIVKVALGSGGGGISWQGHLFGAIGGVLAAFLVSRADRPRRQKKEPSPSGSALPGGS